MMSFDDALTCKLQLCVFSTILSSEFFFDIFQWGFEPPPSTSGYATGRSSRPKRNPKTCNVFGEIPVLIANFRQVAPLSCKFDEVRVNRCVEK